MLWLFFVKRKHQVLKLKMLLTSQGKFTRSNIQRVRIFKQSNWRNHGLKGLEFWLKALWLKVTRSSWIKEKIILFLKVFWKEKNCNVREILRNLIGCWWRLGPRKDWFFTEKIKPWICIFISLKLSPGSKQRNFKWRFFFYMIFLGLFQWRNISVKRIYDVLYSSCAEITRLFFFYILNLYIFW